MNSLDENYAYAVLTIPTSSKTVLSPSQPWVKIFNRLNSKEHLNLFNSIYVKCDILNRKGSAVSILIDLTRPPLNMCFNRVEMKRFNSHKDVNYRKFFTKKTKWR
jgi:hypothetical protein